MKRKKSKLYKSTLNYLKTFENRDTNARWCLSEHKKRLKRYEKLCQYEREKIKEWEEYISDLEADNRSLKIVEEAILKIFNDNS